MTEKWKQWQGLMVDGKFCLHKYLGGSDHSAVFLCKCCAPNGQQTAIKLIPADSVNDEQQLSRWRLASKLSHPHLLHLFAAGHCEVKGTKLLYVVMEYAEEDLSHVLPERPLNEAETRDMLSAVLDALAYLHSQGFVHGHLQPSNIMAAANELKLSSDTLLPLEEADSTAETQSVHYSASTAHSPSANVWSVGMTLVQVLTQNLPTATEEGTFLLQETLPAPYRKIVKQCLCPDPRLRPTISKIQAQLQPASSSLLQKAQAFRTLWKGPYAVPSLAGGLVMVLMAAVLVMPTRKPPDQHAGHAGSKPPSTQPVQKRTAFSEKPGMGTSPALAARPSATTVAEPTAMFVRGKVVERVVPHAPWRARKTIHGRVQVRVRVTVDSAGNVSDTALESPGPSAYFAELAMKGARGWRFTPAQVEDRQVASEWLLEFEFGRAGTRVVPLPYVANDRLLANAQHR